MKTFLAIDQGTTSTKAYRLESDGRFQHVGAIRHRQIRPQPGWVEHDPNELLDAIRRLIAEAGTVDAIGLANQGETVVAWDRDTKRPIYNAIVWQDERTAAAIDRYRRDGIERITLDRAGLPLDAYFSASKLRWLLDHAEGAGDLHRHGRLRLGTSDAFFIDCLAGVFATDVSTASRTSLANLARLQWDPELCAAFGVPIECLPEIRPSAADFGAAHGRIPIVVSLVDQQAALFGHACEHAGDVKITFGTGAFALGLTGAARPTPNDAGLLPTCAWQISGAPTQYALDGGIFTAGAAWDWAEQLGLPAAGPTEHDESTVRAIDRGIVFVPAQLGLACPYWDRSARGAWMGLDLSTSSSDLRQAILEGIALRAAQLVGAFETTMGKVESICVDGGLVRSPSFCEFLADALDRPIDVAEMADVTAFGIARMCVMRLDPSRASELLLSRRRVFPGRPLTSAHHALFREAIARSRGWTGLGR